MTTAGFVQQPAWVLVVVVSHLAIGIGLGLVYFHSIWRGVRLLAGPPRVTATMIAMAARFAILSGALFLTSLEGALPLLATAAGIMAGRFLVMRSVRSASF